MGRRPAVLMLVLAALVAPTSARAGESTCYGTINKGALVDGVRLPPSGKNFRAYSELASRLGRTYVHSRIRDTVVAAYNALEATAAGKTFVYGETGWAGGGRMRPHRTHQNGLSVDFMVPVSDPGGRSVALPTSAANKFGYAVEFDAEGRFDGFAIDFEALAEHLFQLHAAGKSRQVGIALVIIDPAFLPRLFATKRGGFLQQNLPFLRGKAWWRHDEHYHVDFAVACQPLEARR